MRRRSAPSILRAASRWGVAGLIALGALSARPAAAQRESEAQVSFAEGRAAWDRGAYARAVELWSQSYALSPHAMMQINIGNAWLRLGRDEEAASAYRRYLATAGADAPERAEVEELLRGIDRAPDPPSAAGSFDPIGGRVFTWLSLGLTALSAATSVGLWVDFESRYGAMAGSCGATSQGCAASDIASVASERDASWALAAVAIGGLATTLVLWIVEGLP